MYIHMFICIGLALNSELLDDVLPVLSHFYAPAEVSVVLFSLLDIRMHIFILLVFVCIGLTRTYT